MKISPATNAIAETVTEGPIVKVYGYSIFHACWGNVELQLEEIWAKVGKLLGEDDEDIRSDLQMSRLRDLESGQ